MFAMKTKTISYFLLAVLVLFFAVLFVRTCGKSQPTKVDKPDTVTVPAVETPQVVAPNNPTTDVPDPSESRDVQEELDRYKSRYRHYKEESAKLGERLAALDSLLGVEGLACEEKQALLFARIAELEQGGEDVSALVEALNRELSPRRDTGSAETELYAFKWQIDHFGRLMPGGFVYDIDLKEREVEPLSTKVEPNPFRRRNLTGFYGYDWSGRRVYALEGRRQWSRVSVSALGGVGERPWGMVGVGWSW